MDVLSTAHDFGHVFSCCEGRMKNKRCKQVILVITFIVMTFDLVTDWINWKQWSDVGGYNWHHLVFIFRSAFLFVASTGTVLWITETIMIVVKLFRIHRVERCDSENLEDARGTREQEGQEKKLEIEKCTETLKDDIEEKVESFDEIEESQKNLRDDNEYKEETLAETEKSVEKISEKAKEEINLDQTKTYLNQLEEDTDDKHTKLDQTGKSKKLNEDDEKEKKMTETEKCPDNAKETEDQEKGIYLSEENDEEIYEREKYTEAMREADEEQKKKFDENGEYPERMRKDADELYERENYPETVREESEEQEKKFDGNGEYQDRLGEDSEEQKKKWKRQKYVYRLAIILLILTGLLEDFPVVIVTFYIAVSPTCGTPARQEVGSVVTMVTILSSMLNSLWTMVILFCELYSCRKFCKNLRCQNQKDDTSSKQTFKSCCHKISFARSRGFKPSKHCCKGMLTTLGKMLLFGFIFVLFSGNFVMGMLTIVQITGSISLAPIGVEDPLYLRHFVAADGVGPGLDGKRDEAMFIYIEMRPTFLQVILYDDEGNDKLTSAYTNQIINRLYIGQFEELSHLKDGTLIKAIPCRRAFSFVDNVDETLFFWNVSTPPSDTDFSDCKLIFTLRYYPSNNDWNPFKEIYHRFYSYITIEWGIHIHNKSICPSGVRPLRISEVLTKQVVDDLIKYTCSSSCGDDANICDSANHISFHSYFYYFGKVSVPSHLYLAINDLKVADSCRFIARFEHSSKFCNESWSGVQTVDVPQEIRDVYPQFITIPEIYRRDEHNLQVPKHYCHNLWNNTQGCCTRSEDA